MLSKEVKAHILFWMIMVIGGTATIYPYYMRLSTAFVDRVIFLPVWLTGTYVSWFYWIPKYLDKGKILAYAWRMLILLLLLTIIQRYACLYIYYPIYIWTNGEEPLVKNAFLIGKFIQFFAFISLPILFSIIAHRLLKWYKESYLAKQVIAQKQSAELDYLKAQINPHFLFNTLNNLYGLSLENNKKVPGLILKLSEVLSYSLYESTSATVSLNKELTLIKNFVALEQERYNDRINIQWSIDIEQDPHTKIAPLILIPFVENAFKHGVMNSIEKTCIVIKLKLHQNNLLFEVTNSINSVKNKEQNKYNGLGLDNLRRRLQLIYPDNFTILNQVRGHNYHASLKISLNVKN